LKKKRKNPTYNSYDNGIIIVQKIKQHLTPLKIAITATILTLFSVFLFSGTTPLNETWPHTEQKTYEVPISFAWSRATGTINGLETPKSLTIQPSYIDPDESIILSEGYPSKIGILDRYIYMQFDAITVKAHMPFPASTFITELTQKTPVELTIYENPNFQSSAADRLFQLLPILYSWDCSLFY
jgi:hypothetical protein